MVEAETRALIVHVAARAMSVNDPQILRDEAIGQAYSFEMQSCPAAEAFATTLIGALDDEFWEIDGLAIDFTGDEINGAYLDHLGVGRNLESHQRFLSGDNIRLNVLSIAGRLCLRLINPSYPLPGLDSELG